MIKASPYISLLILLIVLVGQPKALTAQEVSLSSEMSIRNYMAYELLGKVDDRYLVYRDKGFMKQINVFNQYLEETMEAEIILEKKRAEVIHTQNLDSLFQMIYFYTEQDSLYLHMRRYDSKTVLRDSSVLAVMKRDPAYRTFDYVLSEDKSKVLLYTMDKEGTIYCYLLDNASGRIIAEQGVIVENFKLKTQNFKILLTDESKMLFVYYDRFTDDDENHIEVAGYDFFSSELSLTRFDFGSDFRRDMIVDYDNRHNKIILCGTYTEKRGKDPLGYYIYNGPVQNTTASVRPTKRPFSKSLISEVGRSKRKKNKIFQNFWVRDIIKRQDGGILVMMELYKEFSRRSSYGTGYDRNSYGPSARRGWVDYYNEDVIISSISPDNNIDWTKILYKKQFSQDDDAVFSSYFVMKTPSRLRLVYNDEIKRSNTVSEYILDPGGKIKRNSLLSTSQQDLKLRFRDAIQISSNEILVPSENNYSLNLVRISY